MITIETLQNVKVTNNSVIISNGKVLRNSCVGEEYFKKYQKFKFRLKYIFPTFYLKNKQKKYIIITDEWSKNYCHFLWESLSKLIALQSEIKESIILVIPKEFLKIDFVVKSLKVFGFSCEDKNIITINKKSYISLPNLSFIRCINIGDCDYYKFLKFIEISRRIKNYYHDLLEKNFGEKIYISRNNPKKQVLRKISNENELLETLENRNFKMVYMEDFSFIEQISIISKSKIVVACHGAGITNFMFADDGHLIEFVNEDFGISCYEKMIEEINLQNQRNLKRYTRINCEGSNLKDSWGSDIAVDIEKINEIL